MVGDAGRPTFAQREVGIVVSGVSSCRSARAREKDSTWWQRPVLTRANGHCGPGGGRFGGRGGRGVRLKKGGGGGVE